MVFDSISNASMASATSLKDFGKKKRGNRSAKLKQSKLDARREQWLSRVGVKSDGCKKEVNGVCALLCNVSNHSLVNLEKKMRNLKNEKSVYEDSDHWDSLYNSPTSQTESSSSNSDNSNNGCYSGSITEEEEDFCFEDWEQVADALAAKEEQNCLHTEECKPIVQKENTCFELTHDQSVELTKPECMTIVSMKTLNAKAWRLDDDLRPQSLPSLSKQHNLVNLEHGSVPWACNMVISTPPPCPICCEDLDVTDSSFLPCFCGFRLCLFCHKRILEEDGRCPACRKPYATTRG